MKASFDVLNEGWIPVVTHDGEQQLLGIRQALENAHLLKEISDPSPLDEYSMYRFLGIFLMDALRPERKSTIRSLFSAEQFDMSVIDGYIELCKSEGVSFDLFDENRPFLQSPLKEIKEEKSKSISALDITMPSGNNHTHFIHSLPQQLLPSDAVKKILSTLWFCTAAAQGYPSGVYGAPPLFGVIKGENLYKTLINLLIPVDLISIPFDDPPVLWRRTAPIKQKAEVGTTSWLQGMLFPTRRIHLNTDNEGMIVSINISQGENFVNKESWKDPFITYRSNDKTIFPLRPHNDRPIWQNICDLIDIPGQHASQAVRLYRDIHGYETIILNLYGVETEQASYVSIHRYDLSLPLSLSETEWIDMLNDCVVAADKTCSTLRKGLMQIDAVPDSIRAAAVKRQEAACGSLIWKICKTAANDSSTMKYLFAEFIETISGYMLSEYDKSLGLICLRAGALVKAEEGRKRLLIEASKIKKEASI